MFIREWLFKIRYLTLKPFIFLIFLKIIKKYNVNNSSKNISLTNTPMLPSTLKRSPSFQTLRESIKRSSAKLVQKLTGASDYSPQAAVTVTKLNDNVTSYEFKYSSKSESLKAHIPISVMSKQQQDHLYTRVNSNENLDVNDEEDEETNSSNNSSSDDLNKNDFTVNKNSKYQR